MQFRERRQPGDFYGKVWYACSVFLPPMEQETVNRDGEGRRRWIRDALSYRASMLKACYSW